MLFRTLFPLRLFVKRCHGKFRCSSTSCFFFPGQGAQLVGMCESLLKEPTVIQLFEDAHKILGYDLLSLCLRGPVEELNKTEICQPAIVLASLAALQYHRAKQTKVFPDACTTVTAGFSVGELTALIFSGALSFEDASHADILWAHRVLDTMNQLLNKAVTQDALGLRVVQVRAQAMQEASDQHPSGMVSIMASKELNVQELCDMAKEWSRKRGVPEPIACTANYLFPGGWVLGGDKSSMQYVLEFGKAKHGIKRAQLIPVSGAFHTKLMKSAQDPLSSVLSYVNIQTPMCTVYSGTSCKPFTTPDNIKSLLVQQLVEPVNWMKTIQNIFKEHRGDAIIYEVGPGKQLRSMISRIDRTLMNNFTNWET